MAENGLNGRADHVERIRVLIVDDEALMRAGIRLMVDGVAGIEVVGEAADGAEALNAAEQLAPDVILMDIRMPRMNGIEATRALQSAGSTARVIVLTAFDTDGFLLDALRGGALSFLLKDADPELVVRSIRDAAAGRSTMSPTALTRLVALATKPSETDAGHPPGEASGEAAGAFDGPSAPPETVTEREWEVGRFVARGLTNSEIAGALFVSPTTVKTHLANLFTKLHVTNRVQLAIRVLEHDG